MPHCFPPTKAPKVDVIVPCFVYCEPRPRCKQRVHALYHPACYLRWIYDLRACLHEGGVPQVGEVTCGGLPHLACKRDHIKMRDCMDRRVTPPKRVTSPTWGPPPPCKQALRFGPPMNHVAFLKTDAHVSNRTVRCVRKK